MKTIRISIFEDNLSRRESLSMLVTSQPGLELSGVFPDCTNVLNNINEHRPDVVLMDIQMPNVDGLEGVRLIHEKYPDIKILMQTVFEDDEKVFNSLRNGATGYILKKTPPEKIIEAIHDAVEGGSPMTPSIASKVLRFFNQLQVPVVHEDFHLSSREKEILALLVDGLSYKMIADRCGISNYTVRAHIRKIYEKLQVHSATSAIAKAAKHKLL